MANSRNYRVPTPDDDANVPFWNDALATDVAADVDGLESEIQDVAGNVPKAYELEPYLETVVDANRRILRRTRADGTHEIPRGLETPYAGTTFYGSNGYLRAELDANGLILESALDESGRVPDWILANWGKRMSSSLGITPIRAVAGFGDSMTDNYGAPALPSYTTHLQDLLGVPVYEGGVSSQMSTEIALRQGGIRPRLVFPSNEVPASGSVTVTLDVAGDWRNGFAWSFAGTVAGVIGVLAKSTTNVWTFARTTAGAAVPIHRTGALFECSEGTVHRDRIQILWAGRNNVNPTINVRDVKAMIRNLTPARPRYLVLSVTNNSLESSGTSGYNGVIAVNAAYAQEFGENYLDVRSYLIAHGLADAGIAPTADDTTAISQDRIPPSLMLDGTHLNTPGRQVVAGYLARTILERNWI